MYAQVQHLPGREPLHDGLRSAVRGQGKEVGKLLGLALFKGESRITPCPSTCPCSWCVNPETKTHTRALALALTLCGWLTDNPPDSSESQILSFLQVRFLYRRDTQQKAKILRRVGFPLQMLDVFEFCSSTETTLEDAERRGSRRTPRRSSQRKGRRARARPSPESQRPWLPTRPHRVLRPPRHHHSQGRIADSDTMSGGSRGRAVGGVWRRCGVYPWRRGHQKLDGGGLAWRTCASTRPGSRDTDRSDHSLAS